MRKRSALATFSLAVTIVLTLALAACGSSSSGSSSSASAAPATPTLPGAPFKIGLICSCSGSQQANGASVQVSQAWVNWTNAHGGINGHPVQVLLKDDAGSPVTGAELARELVESDKVMAIAGESSLVDSAWQKYVEQKNFPVVGGISFESTMFTSPDFYPSGASLLSEIYAFIAQAKQEGVTKLGAFYCAEAPECAGVSPLMSAIGGKMVGGVQVVNSEAISATAPSYVAQCLQAKSAGVQGLAVYASPNIVARIQQQCSQQGFNPRYIGINGVLPYDAPASGNYDGAIVATGNLPLGNTSTSGGKDFAAAMAQYEPAATKDPTWNSNPAQSWVGLQLFAQAATSGKLTPSSTPADVQTALYSLKGETLGGLSGPLTYTKGRPTLQACPFVVEIKNKQWVTLNNNQPQCLSPAAVGALAKVAAG